MTISIYKGLLPQALIVEMNEFILEVPHHTVFQSPAFYTFYQSVPHYSPLYFVARNMSGTITGVMLAVVITSKGRLLSYFSSRCIVYGGPLIHADDKEVISQMLEKLNNTVGNLSLFTQFRNFRDWDVEIRKLFAFNAF